MGPVSMPLSGQKMVRPVLVSPWMMAQFIALAPRCLGSKRGVVLDGLQRGREEHPLGKNVGDERHHVEVGREGLVGLEDLVVLEVARPEDGDAALIGRGAQRVGPSSLGRRRRGDGDDLLTVVEQAFQDGLAEGGLADDRESHRVAPTEGVGRAP